MRISNTYPENAVKLYYIKPGQAFKITPNDGTVDNDIYIMTDLAVKGVNLLTLAPNNSIQTHCLIVSLSTGRAISVNRSKRGVVLDACVDLGGSDRD